MQVIHATAEVIDKNHAFCKSNFIAVLIAGAAAPIFGILNDIVGIRINSAIAMFSLAGVGFFMANFEIYTDVQKFWYLLAA